MAAHTTLVSGTQILRTVREDLARYRTRIQPHQRQVTIVRFETGASDPPQWRWRMEACRISAEQKVRVFEHLGFVVQHLALAAQTSRHEFAAIMRARNQDSATAAVIVQLPVPGRLRPLVGLLAEEAEIARHATRAELDRLTDPAGYLGLAGEMVDRVLAIEDNLKCPVSEVRDTSRHGLTRTSETKGALASI